jgi:hypothetical protein
LKIIKAKVIGERKVIGANCFYKDIFPWYKDSTMDELLTFTTFSDSLATTSKYKNIILSTSRQRGLYTISSKEYASGANIELLLLLFLIKKQKIL